MHSVTVDDIRRFLAAQMRVKEAKLAAGTRLLHDLGIDGDDAAEVVAAFADEFEVDLSGFSFRRHFECEPGAGMSWLLRKLGARQSRYAPITVQDLVDAANRRHWVPPASS